MRRISIYLHFGDNSFRTWTYTHPMIYENSAIIITLTGNGITSAKYANDFVRDLRHKLRWLLPKSFPEVHSSSPNEGMLWTYAANKILIIMGDGVSGDPGIPGLVPEDFNCVLPIFKRGTDFKLDSLFAKFNAEWWVESVSEVLPRLLVLLKLVPENIKIFISYRRIDSEGIAQQLYDVLQHEGAEVFLDSYSVPSGVDFQERIRQQLVDKAMVVMIESPDFENSEWVMYEVNVAKTLRLGICALHLNEIGSSQRPEIDTDNRYPVEQTDYENNALPLKDRKLTQDVCFHFIQFVKERHAEALLNKNLYLLASLTDLLSQRGDLLYTTDKNGYVDITGTRLDYKVALNVRPAEAKDFYYLDEAADPARVLRAVIGPGLYETERRLVNDWLARRSEIKYYNEGLLKDFVDNI